MGLQVSYPYFNQKSRALSSLYIVEFWTLLPYFHFQVTENPTQTGLSIKDNLFIYITKKSRDNWLQVHLVPQVNYIYLRGSFLLISQICFLCQHWPQVANVNGSPNGLGHMFSAEVLVVYPIICINPEAHV